MALENQTEAIELIPEEILIDHEYGSNGPMKDKHSNIL